MFETKSGEIEAHLPQPQPNKGRRAAVVAVVGTGVALVGNSISNALFRDIYRDRDVVADGHPSAADEWFVRAASGEGQFSPDTPQDIVGIANQLTTVRVQRKDIIIEKEHDATAMQLDWQLAQRERQLRTELRTAVVAARREDRQVPIDESIVELAGLEN